MKTGIEERVPLDVREALEVLEKHGHEAYIVGGAVRDLLMGRRPSDYDIATSARPQETLSLFKERGWVVVPKGLEYGVVSVVHPATGREIEVATFRREFYERPLDRRSARVEFARSIEEDLARRDFTINAMAWSPSRGLVDIHGGLRDLRARVVRFVGEPLERIREDPLRMLRLVRFAAQLGFTPEPRGLDAVHEAAPWIARVSRERIGKEFVKALAGAEPWRLPPLLLETGLHRWVWPHLEHMARVHHDTRGHHYGESVLEHTMNVLYHASRAPSPASGEQVLRLAAAFHDVAKPYTVEEHPDGRVTFHGHDVLGYRIAGVYLKHGLRLPRRLSEPAAELVKQHMVPGQLLRGLPPGEAARRLAARHGVEKARLLAALHYGDTGGAREAAELLREAERLAAERELVKHFRRLMTGREVVELYAPVYGEPGPWVGKVLEKAFQVFLRHRPATREELVRLLCMEEAICPPGGVVEEDRVAERGVA